MELFLGDCKNELSKIKGKVNTIITSPPYNFTTKRKDMYYFNGYHNIDNLSISEYISKRITEFKLFELVLEKNGTIFYNLNYGKDNPELPILLMAELIRKTKFTIVEYISWKKKHAIPFQTSPRKLSRIVEMIYLIVRKEEKNTYFINKQVSKINGITLQSFYKNYTNFIEAKNNDRIETNHKARFSVELAEKLILLSTKKGNTVLDPFMGTGTTGVAALNLRRNFVGIEIIQEFYKQAEERLA